MEKKQQKDMIRVDCGDPQIQARLDRGKELCARLMTMTAKHPQYRKVIEELIPGIPEDTVVQPPFMCDMGCNIHLGKHVFINMGCTFLDTVPIRIGANTLVGPDCHLYPPHHPIDYLERRGPVEYGLPITIGEDCWLGGNVTVCPGVSIGNRCIVAAGSVVTKSFPDDCLIAGNPATMKKLLTRGNLNNQDIAYNRLATPKE